MKVLIRIHDGAKNQGFNDWFIYYSSYVAASKYGSIVLEALHNCQRQKSKQSNSKCLSP